MATKQFPNIIENCKSFSCGMYTNATEKPISSVFISVIYNPFFMLAPSCCRRAYTASFSWLPTPSCTVTVTDRFSFLDIINASVSKNRFALKAPLICMPAADFPVVLPFISPSPFLPAATLPWPLFRAAHGK